MEISVTQSTFRPIADLIESNRREHMSSFARLADVLLSLICVRPSSSQCAEIMAEQLKMSLYEIMTDSSETEITLISGTTLSVNTHEKKQYGATRTESRLMPMMVCYSLPVS
ncbi:hypothetical protein [Lonsdalea quercina]|uniref:hypothetical protein n=1 Tax=Lonsdalea quercina TaxID=71657 RepID=UPI003975B2C5